jgi:hypothetical protein
MALLGVLWRKVWIYPCECFAGDLPLSSFCFARKSFARSNCVGKAHVMAAPLIMLRTWLVTGVLLR